MWIVDEWHDLWRLVIAFMSISSVWLLTRRYIKHHERWSYKTRDYWYSLVMWCFAGFIGVLQGIVLDYPAGATLPFITAAAAVSLRGLLRKGEWGGNDS